MEIEKNDNHKKSNQERKKSNQSQLITLRRIKYLCNKIMNLCQWNMTES